VKLSSASLGMAIGERSIALAEVSGGKGQSSLTRCAVFAIPSTLSLDDPKPLGEALKEFLKTNGFAATRTVIGLPARWLLAVEKKLPPANAETAAEVLRMQAERQFPPDNKAMEFDYAGEPDSKQAQNVLLVAATKQHFDRVMELAQSAELKPMAMTSSTLVLAAAVDSSKRPDMLLALDDESAELAVLSNSGPRALRHLPVAGHQIASSNGAAAASLATLGGELFRTATLGADAGASNLLIWDDVGLDPSAVATLAQRSGLRVSSARDLSRLAIAKGTSTTTDASGAAAALAAAGAQSIPLPIDFLHSRLAVRKKSRISPKILWSVIAVTVVALIGAFMAWDIYSAQAELDDNKAWLKDNAKRIADAKAMVAKANLAGGWFSDGRTPVLDSLRYVTEKFPQDPSIWVTSYTLHDNGKAVLMGRAVDKSDVSRVYDHLMADKAHFSDVALLDIHDAGSNSHDYIYSLSFTYKSAAPGGKP
jgi:hypothetical protein